MPCEPFLGERSAPDAGLAIGTLRITFEERSFHPTASRLVAISPALFGAVSLTGATLATGSLAHHAAVETDSASLHTDQRAALRSRDWPGEISLVADNVLRGLAQAHDAHPDSGSHHETSASRRQDLPFGRIGRFEPRPAGLGGDGHRCALVDDARFRRDPDVPHGEDEFQQGSEECSRASVRGPWASSGTPGAFDEPGAGLLYRKRIFSVG